MADINEKLRQELQTDDNVIEGTAVVVSQVLIKRIQATIVPVDNPDKGLDNIIMDAPKLDRAAAWYAMATYITARSGHQKLKDFIKAALIGKKPHYKRDGARHQFTLVDEEDNPIGTYNVMLLEI